MTFLRSVYTHLYRTLLISCFFVSSISMAQKSVPELWGQRVHDEAHVLQPATVDQLEKNLKAYEDSTTNQIAILIIPSLGDEVLEQYSLQVVEKWKLGKKGKDNGVLLLIAVDDHKMRIEVGQGLEGVLTDAQCNRIIRNEIAPEFKRGNFDDGVKAGIAGITKAIAGEYEAEDATSEEGLSLTGKILIGCFIFGILGLFYTLSLFSSGYLSWSLYFFLIPFWIVFPWIAVGVTAGGVLAVTYIIGMPIAKIILGRTEWGKKKIKVWKTSSSTGRSGSSGGSWSSGWGGYSSGGGGSSFSGGGGSFGGGGSSGGW